LRDDGRLSDKEKKAEDRKQSGHGDIRKRVERRSSSPCAPNKGSEQGQGGEEQGKDRYEKEFTNLKRSAS